MRLGTHHSEESKTKMRVHAKRFLGESNINFGKTGEKSHLWKGEKATKNAGRGRAWRWVKCPKGFERHHVDGNPLNNAPENIMFVTRKQHMILDGRLEKLHSAKI